MEELPKHLSLWKKLLGFIFIILVFTLSKGKEIIATAIPAIADDINRIDIVSSLVCK